MNSSSDKVLPELLLYCVAATVLIISCSILYYVQFFPFTTNAWTDDDDDVGDLHKTTIANPPM
jgi:hypothetical protein